MAGGGPIARLRARADAADAAPRGAAGWPTSAVLVVVVAAGLVVLLLVVNLLGISLAGDAYDPAVGGTVADWAAAAGTVVAVPLAVYLGLRQARVQDESLDLSRRRADAEERARAREREAERARVADGIRVDVRATNVLDDPAAASDDERAAADEWKEEVRQRGWVLDDTGRAWTRNGVTRTNAEQLANERSRLLDAPWWITVTCHNDSDLSVVVEQLTITGNGGPLAALGPFEMRTGDAVRRRLRSLGDAPTTFRTTETAVAFASGLGAVVEGRDILGRPIHVGGAPPG